MKAKLGDGREEIMRGRGGGKSERQELDGHATENQPTFIRSRTAAAPIDIPR